jgi:hypothetical protein
MNQSQEDHEQSEEEREELDLDLDFGSDEESEEEDDENVGEDTDSEAESDFDTDDYADIDVMEATFSQQDKVDGQYYLGIYWRHRTMTQTQYIMNASVSARTFLAVDFERIQYYLYMSASFYTFLGEFPEIMQLHITDDDINEVVLKTHWLRLVQRRWKAVYREREAVFRKRASVANQMHFTIHGRYLPGTNHVPSIRGMMSAYAKSTQLLESE